MRLVDFFDRSAALHPERPCLVDVHGTHSYADVQRASHRVAHALQRAGVAPGAKAAVVSGNAADAFQCVVGMLRAGVVWVPVNPGGGLDEAAHVVDLCEVELLFFQAGYEDWTGRLQARCQGLRRAVRVQGDADGWEGLDAFTRGLAGEGFAPVPWHNDDVAVIMCSGGTTGRPKGIMLTHLNWETHVACLYASLPLRSPPVHLVVAPMTHGAGGMTLAQMAGGATHVILDSFDPLAVMEAIERHRVTTLFLPPTAIYRLLAHPRVRDFDYSSLQYFIYAAAPMSVDRLREAIDVFGPVMTQFFGQTEAPGTVTVLRPEEHRPDDPAQAARLASCGRATLLAEVGIMGEGDRLLGAGERGEIVVRGNLVMRGYYRNPEVTATTLRNGWLHTGDVGWRDDAGYFYIVDRVKDMIITGGFNVYPSEVEQVLWSHPAVQDCAVIGVPDAHWGEAVTAIVELRAGHAADADELLAFCRERLGAVKTPKRIEFRPALPKSPSGKVLKKELRAPFWAGQDRLV